MSSDFPLCVNKEIIWSSEALYQACRYPEQPEVQKIIVSEKSPMTAKMKARHYLEASRADWEVVRIRIMRWCLRVKLVQNWSRFGTLLLSTEHRPIVEESTRDAFWAAKQVKPGEFVGVNALGRLLMELREELRSETRNRLGVVEPPKIKNFKLFGSAVGTIGRHDWASPAENVPQVPIDEGWSFLI
jgi:type I restriction enzyme S subunit